MDDIREWNPDIKNDLIHPNDVVNVKAPKKESKVVWDNVKDIRAKEAELNKDNVSAIQSKKHNSNYVIVDKVNSKLNVYDKDNNLIYNSDNIATGKSGNDYNTITYVNDKGRIIAGKGNESTPAGITKVTGKGTYRGVPSFTRGRRNAISGEYEDIAASLHAGPTKDKKSSNGCVRVGNKELCDLDKIIKKGSDVYTLPEKEGSKFVVKDGNLSFVADNPYGKTEGSDKYWDDYNVHIDKSYKPISIAAKDSTDDYEYEGNKLSYTNSISANKQAIQKKFNLDSDTYNRLAELAVGIAEQETKFGTSKRKKVKDLVPDEVLNMVRGNSNRSRGMTQIKLSGDNKEMQKIYSELGIDSNNVDSADKSALATIARLAHMYNTEVKGRSFNNNDGTNVDSYDALLYKWMGRNAELVNKTATPDKNKYIQNVKKYSDMFDFYSGSTVETLATPSKNKKQNKAIK